MPEQIVDAGAMMAAIVGVDPEAYNYFGELETSNKCVSWVKDHLALDEIGVFLKNTAMLRTALSRLSLTFTITLKKL